MHSLQSLSYLASAPYGTKNTATLASIEERFNSSLEHLTKEKKSARLIALVTEAIDPQYLEVNVDIGNPSELKHLFDLINVAKPDLAIAVLPYLRKSALVQNW